MSRGDYEPDDKKSTAVHLYIVKHGNEGLLSGSCHLDRASNDKFSVECCFDFFSRHEKQI